MYTESDTVDNVLKQYNIRADVIKMDIEGAEVNAVEGSTDILNSTRKIIVKIHYTNLVDVKTILLNIDFKVQVINLSGQDYVIADKNTRCKTQCYS